MKSKNKITLTQLRAALERSMNEPLTDKQWDNLIFCWRRYYGKQKAYTDKGWLSLQDALLLQEYAGYPMVNQ